MCPAQDGYEVMDIQSYKVTGVSGGNVYSTSTVNPWQMFKLGTCCTVNFITRVMDNQS
jgi:hypothetical protein